MTRPYIAAAFLISILLYIHFTHSWVAPHVINLQQSSASSKPAQPIKAIIFAGREQYVSILDCYLQRNLVRNGGWLDGVIWAINTDSPTDIEYLDHIVKSVPEYDKYVNTVPGFDAIYKVCQEGTIYIKIDDDVVFFEDQTIEAIVTRLLDHPEFFLVSANLINQPALSWVHYHLNAPLPFLPEVVKPSDHIEDDYTLQQQLNWRPSTLPRWNGPTDFEFSSQFAAPHKNHRWLPLDARDTRRTPMTVLGEHDHKEYNPFSTGWFSWAVAAQQHYSFLSHLENDQLHRYKFDLWNYHYDRLSINFIAFRGEDVLNNMPIVGGDEEWLTMTMPRKLRRSAVLDGSSMAVHFGFTPQVSDHDGNGLTSTDLIHRYRNYAREYVCGLPWGSPMH